MCGRLEGLASRDHAWRFAAEPSHQAVPERGQVRRFALREHRLVGLHERAQVVLSRTRVREGLFARSERFCDALEGRFKCTSQHLI